jgi:hypothetical protein
MLTRFTLLALALMSTLTSPSVGQGIATALGISAGIVKPHSVPVGPNVALSVTFPVSSRFGGRIELSGWTTNTTDSVLFHVGIDPSGNDVFEERALDFPVSDLSLTVAPTYRLPLGGGFDLVPGVGAGLHYVTSDLASLAIDGDSELRPGLETRLALERLANRRVGWSLGAKFDLVDKVNHLTLQGGVLVRL